MNRLRVGPGTSARARSSFERPPSLAIWMGFPQTTGVVFIQRDYRREKLLEP